MVDLSPYAAPSIGVTFIVPTLRVGTHLEPLCDSGRWSVLYWVPTQSMGTIKSTQQLTEAHKKDTSLYQMKSIFGASIRVCYSTTLPPDTVCLAFKPMANLAR